MRYDYRNRMVEYRDEATGAVASYGYDCLGRRLVEVGADGGPSARGPVCLRRRRHRRGTGGRSAATRSLVRYGRSVYGMVTADAPKERWFVTDVMGSIVAEFDEAGAVARSLRLRRLRSAKPSRRSRRAPVLFAGYTYDAESGLTTSGPATWSRRPAASPPRIRPGFGRTAATAAMPTSTPATTRSAFIDPTGRST